MNKMRMNVQTVAEILLQEFKNMEQTTKRIEQAAAKMEQAAKTPLQVDLKGLREELAHMERISKNWSTVTETHKMVDKTTYYGLISLLFLLVLMAGGTVYALFALMAKFG
jgi:hypothetical protein